LYHPFYVDLGSFCLHSNSSMKSMLKKINKGSGSTPSNMASNSSNQGGDTSNTQNGPQFVKKREPGVLGKVCKSATKAVRCSEYKKMKVKVVDDLFSEKATGVKNEELKWDPSPRDMYTHLELSEKLKRRVERGQASEALDFLIECEQLMEKNGVDMNAHIKAIRAEYVEEGSDKEINVPFRVRRDVLRKCNKLETLELKEKRELFHDCIIECQRVLTRNGLLEPELLNEDGSQGHLADWRGNLRKTKYYHEKLLDFKNAKRRGTVLVNSEHCKGMELKLDLNDDEEKGARSPFSSLVTVSKNHLLSEEEREGDTILSVIHDRLQIRVEKDKALIASAEMARSVSGVERSRRTTSNMPSPRLPQSGNSTTARTGQSVSGPTVSGIHPQPSRQKQSSRSTTSSQIVPPKQRRKSSNGNTVEDVSSAIGHHYAGYLDSRHSAYPNAENAQSQKRNATSSKATGSPQEPKLKR